MSNAKFLEIIRRKIKELERKKLKRSFTVIKGGIDFNDKISLKKKKI